MPGLQDRKEGFKIHMEPCFSNKIISDSYTTVLPYHNYKKGESDWRDGMVSGNGENGVICSCSPYSDTHTFQNMHMLMPTVEPRFTPEEVTGELHEARQAVIRLDDTWDVHGRNRTFLYSYHPGHQLRISISEEKLLDYRRETNYETAEVYVKYTDRNGRWIRRTFTSREDNVTITEIVKSDKGTKLNLVLSLDDASGIRKFGEGGFWKSDEIKMQYKKMVDEECGWLAQVAHYPSYEGSELAEGGYAGVTRIIVVGGMKEKGYGEDTGEAVHVGEEINPYIHISGADAVYLISACSRTHHMGKIEEFADMQKYELLEKLLKETGKVAEKYGSGENGFDYAKALGTHVLKHRALFSSVSFCLGDGNDPDKELSTECLLAKQKGSQNILTALVERVYNQGRYAQICCAGSSAPRLCGLWTGEWNPGWHGAYTMDANVNIQVSGMNTGHMYDAALGYIYFILRQIPDWEENAAKVYGMKDALLIPVNTDGDVAVMVEYDIIFPFQYWNAGASWILLPIYEFWQCFGNQQIPVHERISHLYSQEFLDLERDILLPLLRKQAFFWQQLCTPEYFTDRDGKACYKAGKKCLEKGEKYMIIPSYSPENKPLGYDSALTANAAMDISAARDGLNMAITISELVKEPGWEVEVDTWKELRELLPDYKYDETGALCEWSMQEYEENNAHRHISHLYCAWPGYETQGNTALTAACNQAIENRNCVNDGKDDTASHGWVHKGLVAARLKNCDSVYEILLRVLTSDIYFTSLMTNHNTDGSGVYCTDTGIGTIGIINEILLYSNTGEIELLPTLPEQWKKGVIRGLMARTRAEVTELLWDRTEGIVKATIRSDVAQVIRISCGMAKSVLRIDSEKIYENGGLVYFEEGQTICLQIDIS